MEEVKTFGAMNGSKRSVEQTAIAKFWEATAPVVYWPVARSVSNASGRDITDNARPVFGPATRSLSMLPISVDDEGYFVATGDFRQPIGPGFWERP